MQEDIHRIGTTKLLLDDAVAGGQDDDGERAEKIMKSSLLTALRTKFEKEEDLEKDGSKTLDEAGDKGASSGSASIPIIVDGEETVPNGTHQTEQSPSATVAVF